MLYTNERLKHLKSKGVSRLIHVIPYSTLFGTLWDSVEYPALATNAKGFQSISEERISIGFLMPVGSWVVVAPYYDSRRRAMAYYFCALEDVDALVEVATNYPATSILISKEVFDFWDSKNREALSVFSKMITLEFVD